MNIQLARLSFYSLCIHLWLTMMVSNAQAEHHRLTLKVGIPNALPGFEVTNKAGLIISDPQKMKFSNCVEKQLKAHFVWTTYPTARVESMLVNNELDLIFPFQLMPERKANMLASVYVWKTSTYFIAHKNTDIHDKNMRVGVRVNSPEHMDMLKKGYTRISTPYDFASLSRMLTQHLIDFAVVPEIVFSQLKEQWPKDVNITLGPTKEAGYFLNKEDPKHLHAKLNAAIVSCRFE
jgi:hypothetical protein